VEATSRESALLVIMDRMRLSVEELPPAPPQRGRLYRVKVPMASGGFIRVAKRNELGRLYYEDHLDVWADSPDSALVEFANYNGINLTKQNGRLAVGPTTIAGPPPVPEITPL